MKIRTNLILLILLILSCTLVVWVWIDHFQLILFVPVLPAFFLQRLLCRMTARRILWVLPFALVVGLGVCFSIAWLSTSGWDSLGWFLLALSTPSHLVGFLAGWGVQLLTGRLRWIPDGVGH